jgi:hypothetical protein
MREKKNLSYFGVLISLLIIIVFFVAAFRFLDPDFGWHVSMGKLIWQSGIPKTDPFSYTMPSFAFIDHEWLTNVILPRLYQLLGQIGLALIYTVIALLAIGLALTNNLSRGDLLRQFRRQNLSVLPFLLAAGTILPFFGVRPQVESWLLFAIFLRIVLNESTWEKWHWAVPILVLFWTNLHGSFATAIAALFLIVLLRSIREKRIWFAGAVILLLSFLATLFNPYGTRIWHEVWLQISDSNLRWTISEWQPAIFNLNLPFCALAVLSAILIFRFRKSFKLEEFGLNAFFLLQAVGSVRHIPLWVIVDLPMLVFAGGLFYEEIKRIKFGEERFKKVSVIILAVSLLIFVFQAGLDIRTRILFFNDKFFYPKEAISFIKDNLPSGRIFSEYGWGGYLIWNLPQKKVFIDGRMPSWRYNADLPGESDYAMRDYNSVLSGEAPYREVFARYSIDTVLWPKPAERTWLDSLESRLRVFLNRLGVKRGNFDLLAELQKDGWERIYEDKTAVIYREWYSQ